MFRFSAFALAGLLAACSPTAPNEGGNPPLPGLSMLGRVVDNAYLPLPGARVEVVAGQGMGAAAVTDEAGRYQLPRTLGGTVSVRVSKEGYLTSTTTIPLPRNSPTDFVLEFTGPSFDLTGNYTVTFAADAACTQLPEGPRRRTYQASITRAQSPSLHFAELSGAQFYDGYFTASVAGGFASFKTDAVGNHIHERLSPSTSLLIEFFAGQAPVAVSSVSVPMFGTFSYCADDNPTDIRSCRVPRVTCTSSNHTFALTRH